MPDDRRPPEPRLIDPSDKDQVRQLAEQFRCPPTRVVEAVEVVGTNRTAVELFLTAPRV